MHFMEPPVIFSAPMWSRAAPTWRRPWLAGRPGWGSALVVRQREPVTRRGRMGSRGSGPWRTRVCRPVSPGELADDLFDLAGLADGGLGAVVVAAISPGQA